MVKLKNLKASVIVSDIIQRKPVSKINKNMNKKIFKINNLLKSNLMEALTRSFIRESLKMTATRRQDGDVLRSPEIFRLIVHELH